MLDTLSDLARDLVAAPVRAGELDARGSNDVRVLLPDGTAVVIEELVIFPGDSTIYLRAAE